MAFSSKRKNYSSVSAVLPQQNLINLEAAVEEPVVLCRHCSVTNKKKKKKQINTSLAQACPRRSPRAPCGDGGRLDLFQVAVVLRGAQGHSTLGTRLSHVF